MSPRIDDIFKYERELVDKAKVSLANNEEQGSIKISDYNELLGSYIKILNNFFNLTRLSDKQQQRTVNLLERLSRYVSPPLFKKITHGKELVELNQTKRIKLTIFFSDIKDFSAHSINMESESLSTILNSYLEEMTQIVNKHKGTLDKYIGDAIMVFFGDPDFTDDFTHARRCVAMALEMRTRMSELQIKWFELGYPYPLKIRMGISTGFVTVGNFGSSERMDYTIIGSPVNLASRLQTHAAEDQILISHETWGYVRDCVNCAQPVLLDIKGFTQQVLAYEVIGLKEENNDQIINIEDKARNLLLQVDFTKISKNELIDIINKL
jgi:class 3 adenylate cyclase